MPSCLEYIDGSASIAPDYQVGNSLKWYHSNPNILDILTPNNIIVIEFSCNIVDYLSCSNFVYILGAIGEDCGPVERVSDVDCANLSVECDVTAISDTKAWNSNTTQWVDSINVENGDVLTFNVTIFNQGNDDIWDDILQFIMPKCFEYEQNSASYPIDRYDTSDANHNSIYWYNLDIEPCKNIYITFDLKLNCIPDTYENIADFNYMGSYEERYDTEDIIKITVTPNTADPDLEIWESIAWIDIQPGGEAEATFEISNVGNEGSNLNWKNAEYPEWGTWTFIPENGQNLKPEDEPIQVEVEAEAPDKKNREL